MARSPSPMGPGPRRQETRSRSPTPMGPESRRCIAREVAGSMVQRPKQATRRHSYPGLLPEIPVQQGIGPSLGSTVEAHPGGEQETTQTTRSKNCLNSYQKTSTTLRSPTGVYHSRGKLRAPRVQDPVFPDVAHQVPTTGVYQSRGKLQAPRVQVPVVADISHRVPTQVCTSPEASYEPLVSKSLSSLTSLTESLHRCVRVPRQATSPSFPSPCRR